MSGAENRWHRALANFALAGAAILFVLGGFELFVRVIGYEPIYAVYSHPEIFWLKDDLLGWSHQPNAEGTYVGPRPWPVEFETTVRINSLGLRGPEISELPPNGCRVMMLGDSTTAAFEVPWEQTFTALIQAQLDAQFDFPVQVINAGVRGYGADQSYLYYKERGSRLAPDVVFLLYGGNDLSDNVTLHRMRRLFGKGALALRDDGMLEPVGFPIPDYSLCSEWLLDARFRPRRVDTSFESAMCMLQIQLADRSALFTFFSLRIAQNQSILRFLYRLGSPAEGAETLLPGDLGGGGGPDGNVAPRQELNTAILHALAREVRKNGADLILPMPSPYGPDLDPSTFVSDGVTTFKITDDLSRPEFHFEHDSHMNARAHEVVARQLGPIIAERIQARRARSSQPGTSCKD